ncbi:MAG: DUF5060 domain-containing protein [Bacteroidota bacterium]
MITVSSFAQQQVEQWNRFEISLKQKNQSNSFNDVSLTASFSTQDTTIVVNGFYDGNDNFKIRFMPPKMGKWNYTTSSNVDGLNQKKGDFACIKPSKNNHGMVKVSDTYNFKYADGTNYYPFGTTAYAWIHMTNEIQQKTLNALSKSGFNKLRMCVFPKDYNLVKEEPELFPFEIKEIKKDARGKEIKVWDFDKFNPEFFQHLEKRIDDLAKLGIEADLILFHPYDKGRWGFDSMPNEFNIKYLKYLAARVSSFKNVWWSMANEWDYVTAKSVADWDLLTETIVKAAPYRHLCSIHGATASYFNYWKPEFTHVSIQDEAPVQNITASATLKNIYKKPIILDEVGYEGNLKSRWGRYSPEQMTNLVWNGVMSGSYVTHGECYMFKDATDIIFWAKGGEFLGTSWKRIAFLRDIIEKAPAPLFMSDISRDYVTSSAGSNYYLIYFGKEIQESWLFNLPAKNGSLEKLKAGKKFKVEIIDTWDMTIQTYPELFETTTENDYRIYSKDLKKVRLPLKPYMALRITEVMN